MPPSSSAAEQPEQPADHAQLLAVIGRHRRFARGARRDADRRVVEPQHQHIAVDAAGRQPVAGARARRDARSRSCRRRCATISWLVKPWRFDRIGDRAARRVVQRERPEPRLRRDAADQRRRSGRRAAGRCRRCGRRRRRRRPSRSAIRRCARSRRAHKGRCRRVPVFGQAVQAPIVTAPNAVPRVSASHVAPRPTTAATAKANRRSEKQAHDRSGRVSPAKRHRIRRRIAPS